MKKPCFVQDYLRDILEAMDKAEEFTNGLDLPIAMFTGDDKTSFAVIRCLNDGYCFYNLIFRIILVS